MEAYNFTKTIPSWLNQELFDTAIRNFESDPQAKVKNFDIKAASQPGENFASAVFRASVKFTSKFQKDMKELSVIIKTQPVGIDLPDMDHLKDTTLFETEMAMYASILSQIQELMKIAGYEDVMCPRLVYQTMLPKPIIIIEDIQPCGYNTHIRIMHDDFEISKMVVRKLAKFHAAGFYLHDEQKIDAASFEKGIYKIPNLAKTMYTEAVKFVADDVSNWPGFQRYEEPLKKFYETFFEKCSKSYQPSTGPGAFNVLNHGDFHMNNILYKMKDESGNVEDLMMYDYQICVYASPAIDLTYTLYNFVSDENRFTRYDELLATYHEQFVEALKKFGYLKQPPSLLDLQIEMMKNGHIQALNGMLFYPFLIFDRQSLTPEDVAAGRAHLRTLMYGNERFRKVFKKEIGMFLCKGYLGD